jgi:hypothetical protein
MNMIADKFETDVFVFLFSELYKQWSMNLTEYIRSGIL